MAAPTKGQECEVFLDIDDDEESGVEAGSVATTIDATAEPNTKRLGRDNTCLAVASQEAAEQMFQAAA